MKNCIEHSSDGKITVVCGQDERGNRIIITDCGAGIPSGGEEAIFERYTFGRRMPAKGAGLGMSIAAQVLRLHFGSITARSVSSGGAQFCITFPRLDLENIYRKKVRSEL